MSAILHGQRHPCQCIDTTLSYFASLNHPSPVCFLLSLIYAHNRICNHVPLAHAGDRLRSVVGCGPEAGHGVHDEALDQDGGDHIGLVR